jgi:hypothetical protein
MKKLYITLGIVQLFIAIGAIPAGIGYLMDTSGKDMGVTPELLKDSPLDSFLLPGLFLLVVNGLCQVAGAVFSFMKHRLAGIAGIMLGIVLVLWIVVQVIWIGMISFLQPLFFVVGMAEVLLGGLILRKGKFLSFPEESL